MSDTRERCVHGWVDPMEWCTSCMAARIADLEEAARRYFNADGSVSLMVSAEAVVEARKAAALRIAELEAQVREQREALKVAGDALRWLVNVVCGVGKSGDYPSISEDGAAVDAAKSALAHPLIGGAK